MNVDRVLVQDVNSMDLIVWNPMMGVQRRLPMPEAPLDARLTYDHNVAILCTLGADCDHSAGTNNPFFFVFVRVEGNIVVHAWLYSSERDTLNGQNSFPMYNILGLPMGVTQSRTYFVGCILNHSAVRIGQPEYIVDHIAPPSVDEDPYLPLIEGGICPTMGRTKWKPYVLRYIYLRRSMCLLSSYNWCVWFILIL